MDERLTGSALAEQLLLDGLPVWRAKQRTVEKDQLPEQGIRRQVTKGFVYVEGIRCAAVFHFLHGKNALANKSDCIQLQVL